MRYPEGHREKTRARILEAAGRLFKKNGYAATGMDAVMAAANLTTGAFYNHFESKDALFASALDLALGNQAKQWTTSASDAPGPAWIEGFIDTYLGAPHRDAIEEGCPLPSLAPEVVRAGDSARGSLEKHVRDFLPHLESRLEGPDRASRAVALLAIAVGGVVLARAVADPAFSNRILDSCRRAARRLASPSPPIESRRSVRK